MTPNVVVFGPTYHRAHHIARQLKLNPRRHAFTVANPRNLMVQDPDTLIVVTDVDEWPLHAWNTIRYWRDTNMNVVGYVQAQKILLGK
jgi:hypothetical protein